jgi:hypothetical protein
MKLSNFVRGFLYGCWNRLSVPVKLSKFPHCVCVCQTPENFTNWILFPQDCSRAHSRISWELFQFSLEFLNFLTEVQTILMLFHFRQFCGKSQNIIFFQNFSFQDCLKILKWFFNIPVLVKFAYIFAKYNDFFIQNLFRTASQESLF